MCVCVCIKIMCRPEREERRGESGKPGTMDIWAPQMVYLKIKPIHFPFLHLSLASVCREREAYTDSMLRNEERKLRANHVPQCFFCGEFMCMMIWKNNNPKVHERVSERDSFPPTSICECIERKREREWLQMCTLVWRHNKSQLVRFLPTPVEREWVSLCQMRPHPNRHVIRLSLAWHSRIVRREHVVRLYRKSFIG
jgi:hypothetical protein